MTSPNHIDKFRLETLVSSEQQERCANCAEPLYRVRGLNDILVCKNRDCQMLGVLTIASKDVQRFPDIRNAKV